MFTAHELTESDIQLMQHMLGLSTQWHSKPDCYRNYAAVMAGGTLDKQLQAIEEKDFVRRTERMRMRRYHCTEKGKELALQYYQENLGTRAERRYRKYLEISDALPGLDFMEFLTADEFAEARNDI